jgi:hypothetical protein
LTSVWFGTAVEGETEAAFTLQLPLLDAGGAAVAVEPKAIEGAVRFEPAPEAPELQALAVTRASPAAASAPVRRPNLLRAR